MNVRGIAPQATIAALTGLGDMIAGLILAIYFPSEVGWAALLYPPIIGVRGAVSGSLTGRLSSALNVGMIRPRFRENTERFYEIVSSTMMASFLAALISSVIAISSATALSIEYNPLDVLSISLLCVTGTTTLLIPVNLLTSFTAFKRDLDPDVVLYPTMSTLADILVTLTFIGSMKYRGTPTYVVAVLFASFAVGYFLMHGRGVRDLVEVMIASVIVLILEGLAGSLLESVKYGLSPAVLLLYPAMMTEVGDSVSIVGSLMTTRLILGSTSKIPLLDVKDEVLGIFLIFSTFFGFMGVLSSFLGGNPLYGLIVFLISFPATLLITTAVIIGTKGRADPDNFVIPISSSAADLVTTGTIALIIRIGLI